MTDDEKIKKMCAIFNELMPDHLHIGLVPKWIPEHPPKSDCKVGCNGKKVRM